jgi:GNAT superfamily N-acetyltransferase
MASPAMQCRHYDAARYPQVRGLLLDVYAEIYADRLTDPFFTAIRFAGRLTGHVRGPNWEAVVGYAGDEPVGYAYGATRPAKSTAWLGVQPQPDPELARETGTRTFFLYELMVRAPWRKTGASAAIHEELLRQRPEERVSLTVEHDHPKVRALYERWGYQCVGSVRPFPDSPLFDVMLRAPIRRDLPAYHQDPQ